MDDRDRRFRRLGQGSASDMDALVDLDATLGSLELLTVEGDLVSDLVPFELPERDAEPTYSREDLIGDLIRNYDNSLTRADGEEFCNELLGIYHVHARRRDRIVALVLDDPAAGTLEPLPEGDDSEDGHPERRYDRDSIIAAIDRVVPRRS